MMHTGANSYPVKFTYNKACENGLLVDFVGYNGTISKNKIKFRAVPLTLEEDHNTVAEDFLFHIIKEYNTHSKNYSNIRAISLHGLGLGSNDVNRILQAITKTSIELHTLDVSKNMVGPCGISKLVAFIERSSGLRCLNLSRNRLCGEWFSRGEICGDYDNSSFIELLRVVGTSTSIEDLDVSRNLLGEDEDLLAAILFVLESPNKLRSFNISGNNFDSVDHAAISRSLTSSGRMLPLCGEIFSGSCIDLRHCNLKPLDGSFMFAAFKAAAPASVSSLRLAGNLTFGQGGVSYLREVLRSNPDAGFNLTSLDVSGIGLSTGDCLEIANALKHHQCALQSLDISRNGVTIGADGFGGIATAVQVNRTLTSLNMTASVPDRAAVAQLATAIRRNKTLQTLLLSDVCPNLNMEPVISALADNNTLKVVRLSRAGLTSADIASLPHVLQTCSLTSLDMSHNLLCESETPLLATMVAIRHLPSSTCLTELNLSHNKLDFPVVHGIAEALKNDQLQLSKLILDSCAMTGAAVAPFATSLHLVTCLKLFSLARNRLGVDGVQAVLQGAARNVVLEELDISHNLTATSVIDEEGDLSPMVTALVEVLRENKTIRSINIEGNQCFRGGDEARMLQICEGIKANAQNSGNLEVLNIMQNQFAYGNCDPAESFQSLVTTVAVAKKHPKLSSLCGLRPTQTVFRLSGVHCKGPIFNLLADEIRLHHHLRVVDFLNCGVDHDAATYIGDAIQASGSLKKCLVSESDCHFEGSAIRNIIVTSMSRAFDQRCTFANFVRGCGYLGSAPVRLISEYLWGCGPVSINYLKYKKYYPLGEITSAEIMSGDS